MLIKLMNADILNMTSDELAYFMASLGQPSYRAKQLKQWLNAGTPIDQMSNLSKAFRTELSQNAIYNLPQIERKFLSSDGTIKYLFTLADGQRVESVVMSYDHGLSVCVSSQCGCRMGCKFCASNTGGLVRSLQASEMLGQIIAAGRDTGERISGLVLMGIGEPLDNYDNVLRFIRLVSAEDGPNIGQRHISLSTCGVVPNIKRLAEEDLQITLSVSLHAVCDAERMDIMPVAKRWGLDELLSACRDYFDKTGRRISFEYALISGVNDDDNHAERLAALITKYFGREAPCHVNLIPVNEVNGRGFVRSRNADRFSHTLLSRHVNATIRRTLGTDINASCGQLRNS